MGLGLGRPDHRIESEKKLTTCEAAAGTKARLPHAKKESMASPATVACSDALVLKHWPVGQLWGRGSKLSEVGGGAGVCV